MYKQWDNKTMKIAYMNNKVLLLIYINYAFKANIIPEEEDPLESTTRSVLIFKYTLFLKIYLRTMWSRQSNTRCKYAFTVEDMNRLGWTKYAIIYTTCPILKYFSERINLQTSVISIAIVDIEMEV